jgi:PRC-barrel domain
MCSQCPASVGAAEGTALAMTYSQPESTPTTFSEAEVVDLQLQPVGKVTDVLFDNREFTPRWAIVKTGFFGGERFVPLQDSYIDQDGRLVVPFEKTAIKRAPKPRNSDHVISPEVAKELRDYYGVAA